MTASDQTTDKPPASAATAPPEKVATGNPWILLGAAWLLYVAFGVGNRAISPLVSPILADLSISYGQMGFILGAWQLTYIFAAVFLGVLIDRFGVGRCLTIGGFIMGLSLLLRYWSTGFISLLLPVVLFGCGGPMISIGGPKALAAWFPGPARGKAVGFFTTGPILGGFTALALTNSLVMPLVNNSWRQAFVVYAGFIFLAGAVWLVVAGRVKTIVDSQKFDIITDFSRLLRLPNVRLVLLMGLSSFAVTHGFGGWMPKILEHQGFSPTLAGWSSAWPMLVGLVSMMTVPRLTPARLRGAVAAAAAVVTGGSVLAVTLTSGWVQTVSLALYGLSMSLFLPFQILMLIDIKEIGQDKLGASTGLFFAAAEIGGVGGPLLLGALVDLSGAFALGAGACFLFSMIVAGLAWRFKG